MKQILALIMILLILLLNGCGKKQTEITAEIIKEPEYEEKTEEKTEEETITTVKICYDTDKGIIRWEKGTVMGYYSNTTRFEFDDYCVNENYVREYYCENEDPLETIFLCKNGCVDAHCA
ncbi:hypothetical protein ISS05_05160 [Candidatus Woesearchaeota archaeon]|nr:hypothetical protein [Candidatus Woesearchaeota archaeon]